MSTECEPIVSQKLPLTQSKGERPALGLLVVCLLLWQHTETGGRTLFNDDHWPDLNKVYVIVLTVVVRSYATRTFNLVAVDPIDHHVKKLRRLRHQLPPTRHLQAQSRRRFAAKSPISQLQGED